IANLALNKTAIKNFAVWARNKLISEITYKASLVGISEKGILEPLPTSTDNIQFFDIGTGKPTEIMNEEVKQRAALVFRIKDKEKTSDYKTAFALVMEEVAYTWFNRLVAIRFMEVNEYLPSKIRVLSSKMQGKAEPDMVTTPFDTDMEFSAYETDRIMQLKDENKLNELFRMLFIKQCNKLNKVLPELFEKTNDYTEYLLNISFTDSDGIVSHLVNDIAEEDFTEAVQIIGWLYQYYNTEPKEQVFANLKKNIKITKDNIPAATQLFTPDWIVRYMVENSLGRLWYEGHVDDELKSNWKYYLDEAEQEESVKAELDKIKADYKNIKLEEIKLIDPCMGSGHILVYAFDVFMQIYESQGYTERDAAQSIIENNLYGLDIDERAYQLAYFAIMMKARKYDRRFLTRAIAPQVYCPKGYVEGEEYGSLLNVDELEEKPQELQENEQTELLSETYENKLSIWNFRRLLNQKYDVVVTNPPYMGGSGMSAKLSDYVKKNYADSKSDLFACFMEKGTKMLKLNGYNTMVTMQSWMFLSSFEKMRGKLLHTDFVNMAHLGARAFEEIGGEVVQTTSFVMRKSHSKNYKGTYARLVDYNSQQGKEEAFLAKNDLHIAQQENFKKIPGSPVAYWVSEKMLSAFENGDPLGKIAISRNGMKTGENEKFIRLWFEIDNNKFCYNAETHIQAINSRAKWFPYNKGGEYRKWYGNNDYVVNWENEGQEVIKNAKSDKRNVQDYPENLKFSPSASWGLISSGQPSFRYKEYNISDIAGMSFYTKKSLVLYLLAFCNSPISKNILEILAPTINYQAGDIGRLPILQKDNERVIVLTNENINLSKTDWDSFETSWDFEKHPLI
ncbi:MAG: BREX-1 system adenine-specific DNA-methyltransferase PglX, partial [Oscillospiraceae bacterium]